MFRAIGVLIILWGVSLYFGGTIKAFDRAATETFRAVEIAAISSQHQLNSHK